jgi:hypothetical protein
MVTAMRRIPLYDATAPIVCTVGADEVADRVALVERMRRSLATIERSEYGMVLRFPNQPDVEADVRRFVDDEKRCCQFWGFDVSVSGAELVLHWDAPPAADELVVQLLAYFEGDAPLTAIAGLL